MIVMKNENNPPYGALIERGLVTKATESGYVVESSDRKGVVSPPITGITNEIYSAGDRVFFFLFDDGDGLIIRKMS